MSVLLAGNRVLVSSSLVSTSYFRFVPTFSKWDLLQVVLFCFSVPFCWWLLINLIIRHLCHWCSRERTYLLFIEPKFLQLIYLFSVLSFLSFFYFQSSYYYSVCSFFYFLLHQWIPTWLFFPLWIKGPPALVAHNLKNVCLQFVFTHYNRYLLICFYLIRCSFKNLLFLGSLHVLKQTSHFLH